MPPVDVVNPKIGASYHEVGRWLEGFAISHAKREDSRIEAMVEMDGPREGRSYGLRLALGNRTRPVPGEGPIELAFAAVAEGRTRFAWCEDLAQRVRGEAAQLAAGGAGGRGPFT